MWSVSERATMYQSALSFYFSQLSLLGGGVIVFAENSNSKITLPEVPQGVVLEYINVDLDGFDNSKGKGYNEVLLIRKAIAQSENIRKAGCFFKVTGRLKLLNINAMLNECLRRKIKGPLHFLADCKDHNIYEKLHIRVWGHVGECRYWYAETDFFEQYIGSRYEWLNDYVVPTRLAEDLMLSVCRATRRQEGCYDRFRTQAIISGVGGHDIEQGSAFFHSTNYDSWQLRLKCAIRQLLRWLLPNLRI